ncbi:hypothetical protein TD95_004213 [Thielaviopsis punctulata]|uniref:[acyl-carrier-protein] S-malonyltransferase n=1 Tax=Thielaviopsis punctulata TaxID=72032 RepID=A0A0F4ZKI6_9PEZI|nr:hypothetical protein TD95_004213 [Thielaviopsis punctulata]
MSPTSPVVRQMLALRARNASLRQGVQRVAMLTPWLHAFPSTTREFIDELDSKMGYKISNIIQNGPHEVLTSTSVAQPAIMATSMLILRILQRHFNFNVAESVDYTLGHSLGEFAALVASGHLSYADSLRMVHARALAMEDATRRAQAAHPGSEYGMVAVITEPEYLSSVVDTIHNIIGENVNDWARTPVEGHVCIANVNSKDQIVLSGNIESISCLMDRVRHFSGHDPRAVRLHSNTPFHSPLMQPAREAVRRIITAPGVLSFPSTGRTQCVSNISARPFKSAAELCDLVSRSGLEPVRWADSIKFLHSQAQVRRWIGIGPGKVGRNLVGKEVGLRGTDKKRGAGVWAVTEPADIEEVLRGFEETDAGAQMPEYAVHETMFNSGNGAPQQTLA